MKKNYYCLVAGLPDWKPDDKKSTMTLAQLREELTEELSAADMDVVELFFLPHDHANILRQLYSLRRDFDPNGLYSQEEIEQMTEATAVAQGSAQAAKPYIAKAIESFYAQEPRPALPAMAERLESGWASMLASSGNTFASDYADFDNTLRNIFIALQGRKYGFETEKAIIGESDVAEALRKSHAHDFGLKGDVDYLEQAINVFGTADLVEREQRIDAMRWAYIDEHTFFDYFSVEKIIAAVLKLGMVERWASLDDEVGRKRFASIISDIKQSYEKSNNE